MTDDDTGPGLMWALCNICIPTAALIYAPIIWWLL